MIQRIISKASILKTLIRERRFNQLRRKYDDYTMIPLKSFINNLELIYRYRHLEGAVVECGVWRGGMIASMAEVLKDTHNYYLFDSFEGLPKAQEIDGDSAIEWQNDTESNFYFDNCKAEEHFAQEAMKLAKIKNYNTVKGWFSETLPSYNFNEEIAILRLDGDWYESTMDCLTHLYDKVKVGGVIIFDDYHMWDGCSKAVHDYLSMQKSSSKICQFNNDVSYIIKK